MPDLRFAIGAVLAIALLIVAVFGLAATVRVAHHRKTIGHLGSINSLPTANPSPERQRRGGGERRRPVAGAPGWG